MIKSNDDGLIDAIYEAAAIPELWPQLLGKVSERLNGSGGILFANNGSNVKWVASDLMQDVFGRFVSEGWHAMNRRPERLAALNYNGFITDLDVFTIDELNSDPVYT